MKKEETFSIAKREYKDTLRKNRAEAIHMSIFEYDEEKELAPIRKDEYAAGITAGKVEGFENGVRDAMKKTAFRMLSAGTYSLKEIADISGLSIEEIQKLNAE